MQDKEDRVVEEIRRRLQSRRERIKKMLQFLSNPRKLDREIWVCTQFLQVLGLKFKDSDLQPSAQEPPDVLFRDARFEVKEVLEEGRTRTDEYREELCSLTETIDKIAMGKTTAEDLESMLPLDRLYYLPHDHSLEELTGLERLKRIDAYLFSHHPEPKDLFPERILEEIQQRLPELAQRYSSNPHRSQPP